MSRDLYEIGYHLEKEDGKAGWPYVVWFYPDSEPPFLVGEGVECGSGSMSLSALQILDPRWTKHLQKTQCEWLLPLARRMADGEEVSAEEVLSAFEERHGHRPELNQIQQLQP